jgi:hypothetical protein
MPHSNNSSKKGKVKAKPIVAKPSRNAFEEDERNSLGQLDQSTPSVPQVNFYSYLIHYVVSLRL